MTKRLLVAALTFMFGLSLVTVTAARAQSVLEGKITGTVTDDKGEALPGVTVELTGPSVMGKRASLTSARGTYVFLDVPPGTFTLAATMPGFKKWLREGIILGAGKVIEVNLTLEVGAINETITVVGASPIVDAKTSTVDSRLEKDLIAKLPTSRDAFYDLSLTTPGMFDHGPSGAQMPSPTAYSGASNENVFLVNGVNATNPRGSSFGTLVHVNYNAVEEVRVVALGSKAEYGSFSGAAIDVLTKSGSNAFHGSAAIYFEPVHWRTSNQPADNATYGTTYLWVAKTNPDSPANVLYGGQPEHNYEGNVTFGGPIIKDRLWFFGAFDYLNNAGTTARWDVVGHNWERYADIKVSAEPLKNNRAWISYHNEGANADSWSWGLQPQWDTTMTYGRAQQNNTVSAQWQWLPSSTTILTAKYMGFETNDTPHLPSGGPANPGYINWWKWASYGVGGSFPYIEGWHSNRQTIQADVSHYAENFLGEHDLKFGAQWTRGRSQSLGGYFQNYCNFLYPYRWTQYVSQMQSMYGDTGLIFYNEKQSIHPFLTVGTSDSLAFFLDDQWSPSKRWTINLGLRFDRMTAKYGHGYEYAPLASPNDIANPTILRVRADTANIFDFRTWSPRIGVTYQLTKDAKTVARASYGRYYMPITVEYLRRYGPDCPLVTTDYTRYVVPWSVADANGDGYIDAVETLGAARWLAAAIAAGTVSPIYEEILPPRDLFSYTLNVASNLKDQFTDQFTLNLERELFKDFSVSGTFIYKHSGNLFANVPINRVTGQMWAYDRIPFTTLDGKTIQLYSIHVQDYNGDGVVDGQDVAWIAANTGYQVMNMSAVASVLGIKAKRDYTGYQLVFNKRYSNRWQALASLLFSSSSGMANRIYAQDMNFEGPMVEDNNWMSSLNYTINDMTGPLPFTPKFELKVSGSYTIPKVELDLGLRFRMHTGRPVWELEALNVITQWNYSTPPPNGVVDQGIGSIVGESAPQYLPAQAIVDFRVEKTFKLPKYGSLGVVLDVFNLFNSNTPTSIDYQWEWGKVAGILDPRTFRLSFMYQF